MPAGVVNHGTLPEELADRSLIVDVPGNSDLESWLSLFEARAVKALVFASSLKDTLPLRAARAAQTIGMPVIHVLDNWSNYSERLETDGEEMLLPALYVVMDEYARQEAVRAGVPPGILRVAGQPALTDLASEASEYSPRDAELVRTRCGVLPSRRLVVFVSEPVRNDQGNSMDAPGFRGYTEDEVLTVFCEALQSFAADIEVAVLAHPRENPEGLARIWHANKGRLKGKVISGSRGRDVVLTSEGVAGMASLLLYEAWLLGKPVISLQPNLRLQSLRMLSGRDGVIFEDRKEHIQRAVMKWAEKVIDPSGRCQRDELRWHQRSPRRIVECIAQLSKGKECGTCE